MSSPNLSALVFWQIVMLRRVERTASFLAPVARKNRPKPASSAKK
jgi:hypothetical protein